MSQVSPSLQAQLDRAQRDVQRLRHDVSRYQQREGLLRDLHEDVGALLLSLIYRVDSVALATLARSALLDLRDVTRRVHLSSVPVAEALADWRAEVALQVEAVQGHCHWRAHEPLLDASLSTAQVARWGRVIRHAVAVLIGSGVAHLSVQVSYAQDHLSLILTRQPAADGAEARAIEHALTALRRRVAQGAGELTWCAQRNEVRCRIPLTT